MIYRVDELIESPINPITGVEYDASWIILKLTDSKDYKQMCGSNNRCAYTIRISSHNDNWRMSVGDFVSFNESNGKKMILEMTESDYDDAMKYYAGHSFNEPVLRDDEPGILIHSTTMENWSKIQNDGMLKSWKKLKEENAIKEESPIGLKLGDPDDFSNYIMFGGGVTGEIVVNSKESGRIVMDIDAEYKTGARLYFDARKIAEDGLLIRDGTHLKVKNNLLLEPYLVWSATWKDLGLSSQVSTPRFFANEADKHFYSTYMK